MGKSKQIIIFALVAFAAYMVKGFLDAGLLREIEPHSIYSSCRNLPLSQEKTVPREKWQGCEDTEMDRETGLVFIACSDHVGETNFGGRRFESSILLYNVSSDTAIALELDFFAPAYKADFFVHGISLTRDANGLWVYAVSHGVQGDSIYVFRFHEKKRKLFQSAKFGHELMRSMNDVVAVGDGIFYATNDLRLRHGSPLGMAEMFLRLPITYTIGCDLYKQTCFKAATGIRSGNGIAYHKATNRILIAGFLDRAIHVYKRLENDDQLEFEYFINLESGPDNIQIDETGKIWVACHPKVFALLAAASDKTLKTVAPSQIFTITFLDSTDSSDTHTSGTRKQGSIVLESNERFIVEEVFLDRGDAISTASTALPLSSTQTIMSSIYEPKYLICTMND